MVFGCILWTTGLSLLKESKKNYSEKMDSRHPNDSHLLDLPCMYTLRINALQISPPMFHDVSIPNPFLTQRAMPSFPAPNPALSSNSSSSSYPYDVCTLPSPPSPVQQSSNTSSNSSRSSPPDTSPTLTWPPPFSHPNLNPYVFSDSSLSPPGQLPNYSCINPALCALQNIPTDNNFSVNTLLSRLDTDADEGFQEYKRSMNMKQEPESLENKNMRRSVPCDPTRANDPEYLEKRKKNNQAAKRSRQARKIREQEIQLYQKYLERENFKIKLEIINLEIELRRKKPKNP
ncbi:hypothetical protein ABEB36_005702 [Hypothenemus hampei]|uniref:BZIP domain-containing protein n=1 Tax=Hypothenemus hampei TaxID=57062 RepID=A0ABD1F0D1_HYPHA